MRTISGDTVLERMLADCGVTGDKQQRQSRNLGYGSINSAAMTPHNTASRARPRLLPTEKLASSSTIIESSGVDDNAFGTVLSSFRVDPDGALIASRCDGEAAAPPRPREGAVDGRPGGGRVVDGDRDGAVVGRYDRVGGALGARVGRLDREGAGVGLAVGDDVGSAVVGLVVGGRLGRKDGAMDGCAVGEFDADGDWLVEGT